MISNMDNICHEVCKPMVRACDITGCKFKKKYRVRYIYTTRNALFSKLPSGVNDLPEIHDLFPNSGKIRTRILQELCF